MIFPFLLILSLLFLIQQLHHYFAMDDRRFQIESLDGYPFHGTREELRGLVLRRRMPIVGFLPFQLGQRLLHYRDYLLRMPTDRNKGPDGAERGNVFFHPVNSLDRGFNHFGVIFRPNRDMLRSILTIEYWGVPWCGRCASIQRRVSQAAERHLNRKKRCRLLKNMALRNRDPRIEKNGVFLGVGVAPPPLHPSIPLEGGMSYIMRSPSTVTFRTLHGKRQSGDTDLRVGCLAGRGGLVPPARL